MHVMIFTIPEGRPLRVTPFGLMGYGPMTFDLDGSPHRGAYLVVSGISEPKKVVQTVEEIDRMFEAATSGPPPNSVTLALTTGALIRAQEDANG